MRLLDGDVLPGLGFPVFGKGGIELDIQLTRRVLMLRLLEFMAKLRWNGFWESMLKTETTVYLVLNNLIICSYGCVGL